MKILQNISMELKLVTAAGVCECYTTFHGLPYKSAQDNVSSTGIKVYANFKGLGLRACSKLCCYECEREDSRYLYSDDDDTKYDAGCDEYFRNSKREP